jgi:hypothetical protein
VTITTGHRRLSPRHEVSDTVLPTVASLLHEALAGGQPVIPVRGSPCRLLATADGELLVCSVWTTGAPLVTFAVAPDGQSAGGRNLWEDLHATALPVRLWQWPKTAASMPPIGPFCAVRLELGLALNPESSVWLGDFERCVAWAWLERSLT